METHIAPGFFKGTGGSTAEFPSVVSDIDECPADHILDFVNAGLDFSVLEDGGAGVGGAVLHFVCLRGGGS